MTEQYRFRPTALRLRLALVLPALASLCYTSAMAINQHTVYVNPASQAVEPFWVLPGDDLRLIIKPKDTIRYDIAWSEIIIQSYYDGVLWSKTSHSAREDIYDVANAFPGTKFMSVIGSLTPRGGGGGGGGKMPIFQVTVPEVDIDWDKPGYREDSAEAEEDERILWIGPDTVEPFVVRRPIEGTDGMIPSGKNSRPLPDLELYVSPTSGLLVYATQAEADVGENAISFPRLIPRETWNNTSGPLRFFAKQNPAQQTLPQATQEIVLTRVDRDGGNPTRQPGFTGFEGDYSGGTYDCIKFRTMRVDLDIDDVPEKDEETVGGFVPVNANNDNGSTVTDHIPAIRDFDAAGYTDNDLVPILLSLQPTTGLSGTLRLRKIERGRDRIKIWETTGKVKEVKLPMTWTVGTDTIPATLLIEGLKEGKGLREIDLILEYLDGEAVICGDTVKVTVTPVLKNLQATGSGNPWFNGGQSLLVTGTGIGVSISGETHQDGLPAGVLSLIQHMKYANHLADGAGTVTYDETKKAANHTDMAYRGMALIDVPPSSALPWYVLADGGTPWEFSTDDNPMLAIVAPQTVGLIDNDSTSQTLVGVSFLFDIYAAWTFPSANSDDRVVYFLGKTDWSVRYDGDFRKVNGSVVYTAGTENGIIDSTGFSLHNANERTEEPTANEQIGDTWVNP